MGLFTFIPFTANAFISSINFQKNENYILMDIQIKRYFLIVSNIPDLLIVILLLIKKIYIKFNNKVNITFSHLNIILLVINNLLRKRKHEYLYVTYFVYYLLHKFLSPSSIPSLFYLDEIIPA